MQWSKAGQDCARGLWGRLASGQTTRVGFWKGWLKHTISEITTCRHDHESQPTGSLIKLQSGIWVDFCERRFRSDMTEREPQFCSGQRLIRDELIRVRTAHERALTGPVPNPWIVGEERFSGAYGYERKQ